MIQENVRVVDYINKGKRFDQRKPEDFRKIVLEKGIIEKAEGSCRVKLGETEVICGVKFDVGEPYPDSPDEGVLMVGAEFSPLASPKFEPGPPDEYAVELARVVDRGIRESKCIDFKKLCITPGEKVMMLFLDIHVINHDGNLMDASSLAAIGALTDAKVPAYDKKNESLDKSKMKPLKLNCKPIEITVAKLNSHLILDPSLREEEEVVARLTVASVNDKLCALQKGGSGSFTEEELLKAISMAVKKAKELRKLV